MTTIPDAILSKVVEEVFAGRSVVGNVVAEIYAVIKREEALAEKSQALQAHYFCLTCRWHASDVDCCTYAADEIFVDSHGDRFCAECAKQYRGGTRWMERLSSILSHAAPHIEAGVTTGAPILEQYYAKQIAWSLETFGPGLRSKGITAHIRKELREIDADPHDLIEWCDVIMLAMDGYWRHGGKVETLLSDLIAKQAKNLSRNWPDWRELGEDCPVEHSREGGVA